MPLSLVSKDCIIALEKASSTIHLLSLALIQAGISTKSRTSPSLRTCSIIYDIRLKTRKAHWMIGRV
ncbi:hypothetical protein SERLA73DRAFT_138449 [Serpula lacrymans var. lacrymans S7.3]|uniref:Uncharacterized protein n=1 Tax=Serpula lacrymans var. lacrymans (strain S7.3) TaxID=936435 RepID=F8Q1H3_SERL3|nr:hypothetical protein SERLA73DRAFT_138449 [Serpula lacrymans var. lacrymans S7.3]